MHLMSRFFTHLADKKILLRKNRKFPKISSLFHHVYDLFSRSVFIGILEFHIATSADRIAAAATIPTTAAGRRPGIANS